jgi:hypothetical protein
VNCQISGTLTIDGQVTGDGSVLFAGDRIAMTGNNCRESVDGVVVTMNGTMVLEILRGPYNPDSTVYPKSVAMRITSQNFSMSESGETVTTNGDLTLDLTETSATNSVGTTTSTSLTNTVADASGTRTSTRKNYSHKATAVGTTTTIEVTGQVESTNSRLGGGNRLYALQTRTPITMTAAGDFTGGQLEVVGGSGTALRLTVTSVNSFGIGIDTDGNGSFESNATTTRAELESLL